MLASGGGVAAPAPPELCGSPDWPTASRAGGGVAALAPELCGSRDWPTALTRAMARAREGSVSAGAGMERPARMGLEGAYLSPHSALTCFGVFVAEGRMQNGMEVGKQGSLAQVGTDIVGLGEAV